MTGKAALIASDKSIEAAIRRGVAKWYGVKGAEGLRLRVTAGKRGVSALWILKYKGKALGGEKSFSLGGYPAVSLRAARAKAAEYLELCRRGIDPRGSREKAARIERAEPLVKELLREWYAYKLERGSWKNEEVRQKEESRLKVHALPQLGERPVSQVTTAEIVEVLRPIWNTATGNKIASRLKDFFGWAAAVREVRPDNPAAGELVRAALPVKVDASGNQPAVPVERMPEVMAAIHRREGESYRGLAFNILTALRSGVPGRLRWDWITETESGPELVIPADYMKARQNGMHRIPITRQAEEILIRQRRALIARGYTGALIFPGGTGLGMKSAAMLGALRQVSMDIQAAGGRALVDEVQSIASGKERPATVHGVSRACFGTWARENHRELRDVIELCLHHSIDKRYKGAYDKNDYMREKRQLLQGWADYLYSATEGANRGNFGNDNGKTA